MKKKVTKRIRNRGIIHEAQEGWKSVRAEYKSPQGDVEKHGHVAFQI